MQGDSDENHVILLYYVSSPNEQKVVEDIITAVRTFVDIKPADIRVKTKDNQQAKDKEKQYSAYITVPANKAQLLENLKDFKVGTQQVFLRRYFPDYQIYINKLPPKIAPVDLSSHFSKFGQVINVVTTSSTVDKEPGHSVKLSHAFVKLKDSTNINRLLVQNHEINDTELRICRTFQIGESEDTDCKLHLRIDPQPTDLKSFQAHCNELFMSYGELRQRIHLQCLGKTTCKASITYINSQGAEKAMKEFDKSSMKRDNPELNFELKFSENKKGLKKIYAVGIRLNIQEDAVRKLFENYGKIVDWDIKLSKNGQTNCVTVTFEKNDTAKILLSNYLSDSKLVAAFFGKPKIDIFLETHQRKAYNTFLNKTKPSAKLSSPIMMPMPSLNMPMMGMGLGMGMPMMPYGSMPPPNYIMPNNMMGNNMMGNNMMPNNIMGNNMSGYPPPNAINSFPMYTMMPPPNIGGFGTRPNKM